MLKIELRAAGAPGTGALRIQGWAGAPDGMELAVQRNQDNYYLDESGQWGSSLAWTPIAAATADDGSVRAEVGPWLVDPLTADPRMTYQLTVRCYDVEDRGVLRIVGELLSSAAADTSAAPARKAAPVRRPPPPPPPPAPQAEPVPVEPTPEPVAEAVEPAAAPPAKKRGWLWALIAVLVVLAAGGGAAWWWMQRSAESPAAAQDNQAAAAAPEPPAAAAAACGAQTLGEQEDDLALLQGCVRSSPSSQQVLDLIAAAKTAKRCNLVQRLYAYRAQGGDAVVALAYAREYDPASFVAGGCIDAADKETAAYWYELVLDQEPDNQAAKTALEALK